MRRQTEGPYAALALLIAVGFIMLAAACSDGSGGAPASTPTPSPSPTVTATPRPTLAPTSALACLAGDLRAVWLGRNGATGGQLLGYVSIENTTTTECALKEPPAVRLLSADGQELLITAEGRPPCPGVSCVTFDPIGLTPAGVPEPVRAGLTLLWPTHDGAGVCDPEPVAYTEARLVLADGGEVPIEHTAESTMLPLADDPISPCQDQIFIMDYGPAVK